MPYNSFTRALASSRISALKRAQLGIWAKEQSAKFTETGDIAYLEESVRLRQQVLAATPDVRIRKSRGWSSSAAVSAGRDTWYVVRDLR